MTKATPRVQREAALRWVPLDQLRVSPTAQRDINPARVDHILANLDLEQIGAITVSARDDAHYVIDGQHRVAALRAFFENDPAIRVQCWTYYGLTEDEEAERFLKLNDTLAVSAYAKFRVGVAAGREVETAIDRIVRANGCVVTQDHIPGGIAAVGALRTLFTRTGGDNLGRTIRVASGAYGDSGLDGAVLSGIGLALDRYGDDVEDARMVAQLGRMRNGAKGLVQQGEIYRLRTGNLRSHCIAAAAVDAYNIGLGPRAAKRLPSWWKDSE